MVVTQKPARAKVIKLLKIIHLLCFFVLLLTTNFTSPAFADDTANGAQIFSIHCAGCHINGGNIIRRGKNLKKQALKKYGMDSIEAITAIVTNGKSNMSAYKDRLTEQQIQDVSAYVLEQAEKNWR
jgi:cytochrome c6